MSVGVLIVLCALRAAEAAESSPEPTQQAREHFRHGRAAYDQGRFDDAYREFAAGYALSSRPAFLLNMAHAKRRAGDAASARDLYRRYLEAEPGSLHRAEVEARLRELEPAAAPPVPRPPEVPLAAPALLVAPPAPVPSSRAAASVRAAPVAAVIAPVEAPAPPSRRWVWWAAGAGALVAAGVTAALVIHGSGPSYTRQGSLGTLDPR